MPSAAPGPVPGTLAFAETFPDWASPGWPGPHFVLMLAVFSTGNVMLAPITTKHDRCQTFIPLFGGVFPSMYAYGGLRDDRSVLSLRSDKGLTTVYTWDHEPGRLLTGSSPIPLRNYIVLSDVDWQRLRMCLPATLRSKVPFGRPGPEPDIGL